MNNLSVSNPSQSKLISSIKTIPIIFLLHNGKLAIGYNKQIETYSLGSEQYSRSYRKIQNVIADMGGILSVIQTVSSVIVNIIASNLLFIQLSQNIIQNKAMFIRKSINEGVCNTSNSNKVNKTEDVFLASTVSNQKGYVMKKIKETPKKENIKHKTSLFKKIGVKDFILFLVGCSKSNGSNLIELSRRITLSSLSCDTLIKMNINQQKLIEYVGDKRKKEFYHLMPELLKQLEENNLVLKFIDINVKTNNYIL